LAALKAQDDLGDEAVVATVFADDNKKYLSTDLLRDEPVKSHYRAPEVVLTGFRTLRRVCNVCCDAEGCEQKVTIV
jgi:cysteine synthase A